MLAAGLGHLDIVKMCQAKGADTEIRDPETGATPLINAAKVCIYSISFELLFLIKISLRFQGWS